MKFRPKFSLLTMLLVTLLAGCGMLLGRNWAPWQIARTFDFELDYYNQFSADSRYVLNGGETCALWDLQTGKKISSVDLGGEKLGAVSISADCRLAAAVTEHPVKVEGVAVNTVRIWEPQTGRMIRTCLTKCSMYAKPCFLADGKWVCVDNNLIEITKPDAPITVVGSPYVGTACFFDKALEEANRKRELALIQAAYGSNTLGDFIQKTKELFTGLSFSPSGKTVITFISPYERAQVWDWATQKRLSEINYTFRGAVFLPDEERILVNVEVKDCTSQTQIVDLKTGELKGTLSGRIDSEHVQQISNDGRYTVLIEDSVFSKFSKVYDLSSMKLINISVPGIGGARLSPEGKRLLVDCDNGETNVARIVDVATGDTLAGFNFEEEYRPTYMRFGNDESTLYMSLEHGLTEFKRVRPERWWGVVVLGEFWAVVVMLGAVVWSVRRDAKRGWGN